MFKDKTFLAVIPARGGSKRLPQKNVLNLAGKPLISWTIEAAKKSKYIDEIIVTSDDEEILNIAKVMQVDTITRPAELASDTATTFDVVKHAIKNTISQFEYVVLLQPTSPLRTEVHIDEAIQHVFDKQADAIISVCETDHSPLWSNTLPKDGNLENFISDKVKSTRSQDLPKYYRLNGAIYICETVSLLNEQSFFISKNIYSYIMDQQSSIDVDTVLDFNLARILIDAR